MALGFWLESWIRGADEDPQCVRVKKKSLDHEGARKARLVADMDLPTGTDLGLGWGGRALPHLFPPSYRSLLPWPLAPSPPNGPSPSHQIPDASHPPNKDFPSACCSTPDARLSSPLFCLSALYRFSRRRCDRRLPGPGSSPSYSNP